MKSKGFTLLEVIAAIFVLVVGLGASFSLIHQTLSAASIVKSRLVAAYLAQEGIEIVKNTRDSNWLEQRVTAIAWNEDLTECQPPAKCCESDYKTDTSVSYPITSLLSCDYDSLRYLNIDNNGFYSYAAGTPTKFKRNISIDTQTDKVRISVEVVWEERGRIHTFKALEDITNWY